MSDYIKAYEAGKQARLEGKPIDTNPYEGYLAKQWDYGWKG
jgi:hypothetical protein